MGDSIQCDWEPEEMDGRTRFHRFRYHLGRGFVKPGDTVVDGGCGKGYGSEILSGVAKKVIGIDIDEIQIPRNRELFEKAKNIEFKVGSLEEIKIPECDVFCSFEVIEHLYDANAAIQKIKAKTKKWAIISVPIGESLHEVDGDIQVIGDPTHHSTFAGGGSLDAMFIDDDWRMFISLQLGVTYVGVYYNKNGFV